MSGPDAPTADRVYRCGSAARWLPRVLGGTILAAALLVAWRFESWSTVVGGQAFRTGLVVGAAIAALWVVRKGGEVRIEVGLSPDGLVFSRGPHRSDLPFGEIESMRYEAPFGESRNWVPATVLMDRRGTPWRISGFLGDGDGLIDALIRRSEREDLAAWADALKLHRKMAAGSRRTALGYGASAVVLLAALAFYLH